MTFNSNDPSGGDYWWSRVIVTSVTAADLKVVPTASATGTARQRRLVITGWTISGHNTNAAATTFVIRNKTTTTTVFMGGSMIPLTGVYQSDQNGLWLPGAANETIEISVAGAITGQIAITMWGRSISADAVGFASKYTGAP